MTIAAGSSPGRRQGLSLVTARDVPISGACQFSNVSMP